MRARSIPLAVLGLAASCAGPARPLRPAAPAPAPPASLLLVTIDTLRALSCTGYGHAGVTTPHLDALGRRGMLVPAAYAATDLTNPSHATLMTGVLPATHGVYSLKAPLPEVHETLAEALRREGYATAAVVSVNHLRPDMSGLHQGFSVYEVPVTERDGEETSRLAGQCLAALPRPWLLWVHFFDPHMPYAPPAPYLGLAMAAKGTPPEPPPLAELIERFHVPFPYREWLAGQDLAALPAMYEAEVARADHELGCLLQLARQSDPAHVAIVTSDHGEGLGEHGIYYNHIGLHEETLRVPLVLAAPGRLPAWPSPRGPVPSHRVKEWALALAGGGSVTPGTFAGGTALSEMRFGAAASLTEPDRKLIWQRSPVPPLAPGVRLFDLDLDPGELRDATAGEPALAEALREDLERRLRTSEARGRGRAPDVAPDEETLERLRSLGYVDP